MNKYIDVDDDDQPSVAHEMLKLNIRKVLHHLYVSDHALNQMIKHGISLGNFIGWEYKLMTDLLIHVAEISNLSHPIQELSHMQVQS